MAGIKMLLSVSNWTRVLPVVKETFFRFPLSFICTLCATLIALLLVHEVELVDKEFIGKCLASMIYAVIALTSFKLLVESENWSAAKHAVAAIATMAVIIFFVWAVFDESTASTYIFFSLAVVLSLLFAPYIKRQSDPPSVWYFNYQTGVAVFFAGLSALALGIGMSLILASIGYLFEIKIPSKVYGDVWVLCWGVLFPIYVLANISKEFDFEDDSCDFPKGVSFITNYILAPLMVAYMAILYAYFLKIIVQWELPRGNLGWMITTFGTIGITTKLLAYPIRSDGTRLLVLFDKYYYYALIVPILLLAIAIGVRINDYGVTEQRYAVLLLGLWFSAVTLMAAFKKDRFHIKNVPIILAALALLASFGPWGAVEVSINSQVGRFESLLTKHQLLVTGQAAKANGDLPFVDRKTLSSIADYLGKSENRLKRIRPWFKSLMAEDGKKELTSNRWGVGKELVDLLGVNYVNRWQNEKEANDFNYSQHFDLSRVLANVSGFDYVGRSGLHRYGNVPAEHNFDLFHKGKHEKITVEYKGELFTVKTVAGEKAEFNLAELIRGLREQNITQIASADLGKLTLTQSSANGRLKVRLLLEQIQGKVTQGNEVNITNVRYVLMLKFYDRF